MFRFNTLINHIDLNKMNVSFSKKKDKALIYNKNIIDELNQLTSKYDKEPVLSKNYKKILYITHPFEILHIKFKTNIINNTIVEATNAYMKMYEFLEFMNDYILKYLVKNKTLTMFDVAGAPGMFVIAANQFCKKNSLKLDWYACSLERNEVNSALKDTYKLYKTNPDRYISCDVTKESDIKNVLKITGKKFSLVTGDIGTKHENYYILQEFEQLDLEWGQMITALNLVDKNGIMFLKMYTYVSQQNMYMLDLLTNYFETVYITKPKTSRLMNFESYILCVNRNTKDISNIPIKRPYISEYRSPNEESVLDFERTRNKYKLKIVNCIVKLLKDDENMQFKEMIKRNKTLNKFFNSNKLIFDILVNQNEIKNKNKNKNKNKKIK